MASLAHKDSETGAEPAAAIMAATETLLAEHSIQDLSVAQILAVAGVSRATFYFYFRSKFSVVAALVRQVTDEIFQATRPTVNPAPGPAREAALRQRIHEAASVWDAHRPVLRAMSENWHSNPEMSDAWLAMIGELARVSAAEIERDRGAGLIPPGVDATAMGSLLAWLTERSLYSLGVSELVPEGEREAHLEALVSVWLTVLAGGSAPPA